jgi:hypothetical protein
VGPLTSDVLLALVLGGVVALMLGRWLRRRATFRDFAAGHGFHFRGVVPSDKYEPYIHFGIVRGGVLLYHAMEGRWHDLEVAVFDFPERRGAFRTGVIASLPPDVVVRESRPDSAPGIGPSTASVTLSGAPVFLETNDGYLLVRTKRQVAADELPQLLDLISLLARGLDADGRKR